VISGSLPLWLRLCEFLRDTSGNEQYEICNSNCVPKCVRQEWASCTVLPKKFQNAEDGDDSEKGLMFPPANFAEVEGENCPLPSAKMRQERWCLRRPVQVGCTELFPPEYLFGKDDPFVYRP